jgi:hypothetical protein
MQTILLLTFVKLFKIIFKIIRHRLDTVKECLLKKIANAFPVNRSSMIKFLGVIAEKNQ